MKLLTWKSFLLHLPLNNERGKSFADWLNRDLEKCLLVNEENGSSLDLTPNEKRVLASVILTSKFNRDFIRLFLFLLNIVFTWVSAFKPSGTEVRLAFTHSTVSLPFFHLHSQNEGQSFGSRGDFWLQV